MSPTHPDQVLADAICRHVAGAVATLIGGSSATAEAEAPTTGWHIRLAVGGRGHGNIWLGVAANDAVAIARRILGSEHDPAEGVVRETLQELVAQAVSAVALEPLGAGLEIAVERVEPSFDGIPSTTPRAWAFQVGDGSSIVLAAWSQVSLDELPPVAPPRRAEPVVDEPIAARVVAAPGDNLDLILDIELPMSVRFGKTELALGALTRLGPGSVIDL